MHATKRLFHELVRGTTTGGGLGVSCQGKRAFVKIFRGDVNPPTQLTPINVLREKLGEHVSILKDRSDQECPEAAPVDLASLEPRSMSESWDQVVLPLGSQPELRNKYLNFMGYMRFGKILEDLDTFAVWISYRHNQGLANEGKPPAHHPMALVTACVDRIDLTDEPVPCDEDLTMEGHISWVGTSSLEVTMRILRQDASSVLSAKFVMVALHPGKKKTVKVHPLITKNSDEKAIVKDGEQSKNLRKQQAKESLLLTPPSADETKLQHELFRQTIDEKAHSFTHRVLPPNSVWMESCKLKNVIICQPEQKNLYNKIFDNFMQVRVHAEVVDVEAGKQDTTNTFHFTFSSSNPKVPNVVPKTYADGMLYLSGKRHFDEAMKLRRI